MKLTEREKIEAEYRAAADQLHRDRLRFGRAVRGADDPGAKAAWVESRIRFERAKADLERLTPS